MDADAAVAAGGGVEQGGLEVDQFAHGQRAVVAQLGDNGRVCVHAGQRQHVAGGHARAKVAVDVQAWPHAA